MNIYIFSIVTFILLIIFGLILHRQASSKVKWNYSDKKQLSVIINNNFYRRKLMNKSEYRLFCYLEQILSRFPAHQFKLFSQVSLGEIIGSKNPQAFKLINSKRVDFLIINNSTREPIIVIEYQGSGHYQGNAIVRDAIKRKVCQKAGIIYVEFPAQYGNEELNALINLLKKYH